MKKGVEDIGDGLRIGVTVNVNEGTARSSEATAHNAITTHEDFPSNVRSN